MFSKELQLRSSRRTELIDITPQVEEAVRASGVQEGICLLYVPHTTAGITVNENADPSVKQDILEALERLVPPGAHYKHTEGNADSHKKATLVGSSVMIPVAGGRLAFGTWQGVFFCEFDGPRSRRVLIKVF